MATQGKTKKLSSKVSVPSRNRNIPTLPMDVVHIRKSLEEDIMGWIACCVLIALLLPLMGILYLDILDTKNEAKSQVEKIEKLTKRIEQKEREKDK